ncbi:unnamed protein product [Rangifer tarandus platyrhynchus]|uniref:Uncharacterized protein n=3 Tax=Rangifer tarandus platyrhynchus TaxID=3082113 RepID=A0AC59ZPY5_RANTA|nr:unnamed protein product [Rangifer tarandus platyrhynchus]CAI9707442.1 unnamed protein product [Rangifer tarandus platyrhynchus]
MASQSPGLASRTAADPDTRARLPDPRGRRVPHHRAPARRPAPPPHAALARTPRSTCPPVSSSKDPEERARLREPETRVPFEERVYPHPPRALPLATNGEGGDRNRTAAEGAQSLPAVEFGFLGAGLGEFLRHRREPRRHYDLGSGLRLQPRGQVPAARNGAAPAPREHPTDARPCARPRRAQPAPGVLSPAPAHSTLGSVVSNYLLLGDRPRPECPPSLARARARAAGVFTQLRSVVLPGAGRTGAWLASSKHRFR